MLRKPAPRGLCFRKAGGGTANKRLQTQLAMKYHTASHFCRNVCIQLLNCDDPVILRRCNSRLWPRSAELSDVQQLFLWFVENGQGVRLVDCCKGWLCKQSSLLSPSLIVQSFIFNSPERKRESFDCPNGFTQPCAHQAVRQYSLVQCSEIRCWLYTVISGPAYFQETEDFICTSYILICGCKSLLILSNLKMNHVPVKGLTGADYGGVVLVFVFFFSQCH